MAKLTGRLALAVASAALGATLCGWGARTLASDNSTPCIDSLEGTGATLVARAKGDGGFSCSRMSPGPDGGHMKDITHLVHRTLKNGNTEVDVLVPTGLLPEDEIDAVYISKGNGERCLYSFSDYSELATGLRRQGNSFHLSDVTVCSDGIGKPPAPPPLVPISTAANQCSAQFTVTSTDPSIQERLDNLDAAIAFGEGGSDSAVCNIGGSAQVQCVDICNDFQSPADDPESNCPGNSDEFGQLPLDCRPCALTDLSAPPGFDQEGNPLFYCWEYENSVVRDPPVDRIAYPNAPGTTYVPGTDDTELRTPGTILPHKPAGSAAVGVKSFNACKTIRVNGTSYTKCF